MHQPTRHVVMSFVSADDATVAVLLLHQLGADVASYTPAQMRARAAIVLGRACSPTAPGLEPALVTTQRELARRGHSFVLARADMETLLRRICRVAAEAHAHSVQTSTRDAARAMPAISPLRPMTSSAPTGRWQTAARPSTVPSVVRSPR